MQIVPVMLAASAALVAAAPAPAQADFVEVSGTGLGSGYFFTGTPDAPPLVPVALGFNVIFDTDTGTCGQICFASLTSTGFTFSFNNQIGGRGLRISVDAAPDGTGALSGRWTYSATGVGGRGEEGVGQIALSTRARPGFTGPPSYSAMLAAVPEPAVWAMMIAGFGAIGGAVRRDRAARRRPVAVAA